MNNLEQEILDNRHLNHLKTGKNGRCSALTYYEHMLIINAVEGEYDETEVLPSDRRHAG